MANVKANRQTVQLTALALRRAGWLALIYIVLIFVLPANEATLRTHHLSAWQYRLTLLAVTLPLVLAWVVAFVGYARLREYVQLVRKTPEGVHFDKLATGTAWLAWSLPLPAIVVLLLGGLANHWPGFYATSIIISNYLELALPLVAFSIIGVASRGLVNQAKLKISLLSSRLIMLLLLAAGVLYCYLAFQHLDLSSLGSTHNPYFLPLWLMVLSLIIPYLYAWFVGLVAAYEITLFSRQTTGVLYHQALRLLALGLVVIIASSIAQQYISGVQPRTNHLIFGYHMVLSSIFYVLSGVGFALLAIGANRLKKIEEI